MLTTEFSNEFDILYNNVMSDAAPGLDEYEKSVFLTKAQDEVLKNYFNPAGNKYQHGFDGSPKRQIDFSMLIDTVIPEHVTDDSTAHPYVRTDERSVLFLLPTNIFLVLNETVQTKETRSDGVSMTRLVNVVPISFDEYANAMSKPYKQPLKNQAWRLLHSPQPSENVDAVSYENGYIAEVIFRASTTYADDSYRFRYLRRPRPIILADLSDAGTNDVTIDGYSTAQTCELDPILHKEILQRAVELAKAAYTGDVSSTVQMGQRSE